jgi:hypothetical protein
MKLGKEQSLISDMIMAIMGVDRLAYVKPVMEENDICYVVYAADGTELASFDSRDEALLSVKRHNLTPVNIH